MGKYIDRSARILIYLFLSLISVNSISQTYQFRNFSVNNGLDARFIYTINQDNQGFIWLGTSKGISRFDGFNFYQVESPDTLSTAFPVSSLIASDGTIYYGYSNGQVYRSVSNRLERIEGIDAFRVNSILEEESGDILFFSQSKGTYHFDPRSGSVPKRVTSPVSDLLYSAIFTIDGDLLIGTQKGLILTRFNNDQLEKLYESPDLSFSKVQALVMQPGTNRYFVGTEYDGVFSATLAGDSIIVERITEDESINQARVQSLLIDASGYLWISTFGEGVFKVIFDSENSGVKEFVSFNKTNGLTANDVKTLFQDNERNLWMGLYGDGVSILGSDAYSFYRPGNGKNDNNIVYVGEFEGNLLAGTQGGFYLFDAESGDVINYTDLSSKVGSVRINMFHQIDDGSLLIGTDGNGVFHMEKNRRVSRYYSSSNNLQNYINDINHEGDIVWIATMGGVIMSNSKTQDYSIYTTYERLPHNAVNHIIPDGKGKFYVATEGNRLYTVDKTTGVQSGKAVIYGGVRNRFQSLAIDSKGKIWGATLGAGVYCFSGDSVWGLTTEDGLLKDFCYSILVDSRDNIWIGHEQGFSVYDQEMKQLRAFEDIFSEGADCNKNSVFETSDGLVIFGTTEGIMVYDYKKDQSRYVPPVSSIISVTINNIEYPFQESYQLPYKKRYDIKVNYVGLYYSDPEKVWYTTRLDNYDLDWSDPTFSRVTSFKLSDGNYRFNLMSYNYDGVTDNQVVGFNLTIRKPAWRMWWFLLGMFILASGIVVIIVRIRDRAQRRVKIYLEDELAERTKVVMIQKEEIELQNREITDSINYAQRIQASLLPSVDKLSDAFNGSFVFYRPRDIVSGDFYWFEQVDSDRFLIVCADSTGHGVPGAFMSMIGSALIQEIVTRKEITRPSEVLSTLDREIARTLNQGEDGKTTSDGMDMVVCEFNKKTKLLRFASAMRPVILIMKGEQYYIRGNKNSVGGESVSDKYFDDQEYYLKENDSFYLFSDGLPDQFGGDIGKKMKIANLKKLIDDFKDEPMSKQYEILSNYFDEWKGDLDQVDDVLFMGIRV
jgi:ligand-binding sensor domain-containing protein/serine phosphatase RsbU (regulator of sigma subunit)